MADIKLSDIFGGGAGISDQVITNKNDIATLKSDRVKKAGDTMNGDLKIEKAKAAIILKGGGTDAPENYGRVKFEHMAGDQHVHILHSVHDTHRAPFGLRVQKGEGNATSAAAKAWLEAEGEIYADGDKRVYHEGWKQPNIAAHDVRSEDRKPSYFQSKTVSGWFNNTGMPTNTWYSGITVKGWENSYNAWQLFAYANNGTPDNKLYFRFGKESTWNTTYEVFHTGRPPTAKELGVYTKSEVDQILTRQSGFASGSEKEPKSLADARMINLLVESIKELNNKIERLEALVKE